jgi:DNA polymerase I-like protein with 3'-5' exonuclease and polymerase domains
MTEVAQSIWSPDYDTYVVVDAETTVRAPDAFKFKAHPAFRNNEVVAWGALNSGWKKVETAHGGGAHVNVKPREILVGHNVKFDMQYMAKRSSMPKVPVWDTGVAHYMMTGQKAKMPSLNEVAEFYGVGQKHDGIAELWDMGVQTEDIEPEKLLDYLKQDIELTHKVYLAQQERLKDIPKLRDHILRVSTASAFLGGCELYGLPIDGGKLYVQASKTDAQQGVAKLGLYMFAERRYGIPTSKQELWDPTTPKNIGRLLFDLPIEIEDWEPAGRVLKSGKISKKRRRTAVEYKPPEDDLHAKMLSLPVPKTASGAIQTSDDLLDTLASVRSDIVPFVKEYRATSKLHGTYLQPTVEWRSTAMMTTIHPSFHLTTTNTGRTSSSGPNAQQFPPELEATICAPDSRTFIVKADFKQLQMCGVAMLSGDTQLIYDLNHDVDVHYETGKMVFSWKDPSDMDKATRRVVKNINFGLLFGGRAKGLARQTGVTKEIAQKCIDAFNKRYPGVSEWVKKNCELVESIAQPAEGEFINGHQVREAFLQTPAGRILRFVEREAPAWVRKDVCFSPNEIANYPVQAYCDGDLALIFLAILSTSEGFMNTWTPLNFVHDSVWVMTTKPDETKLQLQAAVDELNTKMGLSVPLKLDFTVEDCNGNKVG